MSAKTIAQQTGYLKARLVRLDEMLSAYDVLLPSLTIDVAGQLMDCILREQQEIATEKLEFQKALRGMIG